MTAIGAIAVVRWHGRCGVCAASGFAADGWIGVSGWLTVRARRMSCLAGLHDPFRQAERLLQELAGWSIDAETLRRHTHEEAREAARRHADLPSVPQAFVAATGAAEVHIDAGKVNTPEGWRDVKVAVFAVREPGTSSTSADYEQRDLPAPTVRSVVAAIEEAGAFGGRCATEAQRLGLTDATRWGPTDASRLSVLGDGAEWIWKLADRHFAQADQLLDIYHAVEHLATAGRAAIGDGPALVDWLTAARRQLIGDGYCGVCTVLAQPLADADATNRLAAVAGPTLNYFAGHQNRLTYAARLRRGQVIGSGLVEGTIKQLVNLRLKRTGARWRANAVGPFVELLAKSDSTAWHDYWTAVAA